jgi:hypothetical protein
MEGARGRKRRGAEEERERLERPQEKRENVKMQKVDKLRRPMHADDMAVCLTSRSAGQLKKHPCCVLRDIHLFAVSHVSGAMPGQDR